MIRSRALRAAGFTFLFAAQGCSSSSAPSTTPPADGGDDVSECPNVGTPTKLAGCSMPSGDVCNPPGGCAPADVPESVCPSTAAVDGCPADTSCMAASKQSGTVLRYRMGRIELWAPASLMSLEPIALTPFVNAACVQPTTGEGLSWLLKLDLGSNTLVTGGAHKSTDHKTFSFATESIDPSALTKLCAAFGGSGSPVSLAPVTVSVTVNGDTFSTATIPALTIPVFDTNDATMPPVLLPLREAYLKNVTISTDRSCIGAWDKPYYCNDSKGWTTGGQIIAKITADDADRVPVRTAGCQSLCKLLVNDASKSDGLFCKKGTDGHVIADIGDSCVGAVGCKNAFLLSATFAAYGVDIVE